MIHSMIFVCMVVVASAALAESELVYNDRYPLWLPEGMDKSDAKQLVIGEPGDDDLFIVSGGQCENDGSGGLIGNYTIWMLSMELLADSSESPVIAEYCLNSGTDYTNQKACAVAWEDTDELHPLPTVITSGYDRIPYEEIASPELGWDGNDFEWYGTYRTSMEEYWDPFISDVGHIPNWNGNQSFVVSGSTLYNPRYTNNMAFCMITDLDNNSNSENYECDGGQDANTMWGWLEVTDENEIYLSGVGRENDGDPFNKLCLGIPYISTLGRPLVDYYETSFGNLSDLNVFRSRIACWTSGTFDFVLMVSNGSSNGNIGDQEETIAAAAWKIDGNGVVYYLGSATYTITGFSFSTDHLFPFALQPYPNGGRALLLLSYHKEYNELRHFNLIQAVDVIVDEHIGTISFDVVGSADECSVPLKTEDTFNFNGIHPRDFAFTAYPNENNYEFAGVGCGTMQAEYGDDNTNKRIWMFEIERSSDRENVGLDHSDTVQAIRLRNPSSSRIEFYGMPFRGDDIVQVDVYDILGRLVARDESAAAGELMRDGIPVDQLGVYYVVISSPGSDLTYTGKTVVLER